MDLWMQLLLVAACALVAGGAAYWLATHRAARAVAGAAGASLLADLRAALRVYLSAHPLTGADLDGWLDAFGAQLTDPRLRGGYTALRPLVRELALEYLAALVTPAPDLPAPRALVQVRDVMADYADNGQRDHSTEAPDG